MKNWDGSSPIQGVNVLKKQDFDLNILTPTDPETSPHWTSTKGNTYCTAWQLSLKGKTYDMIALVPECEVWLDTFFFEGIATIYEKKPGSEPKEEVGHAFVEQMGYN